MHPAPPLLLELHSSVRLLVLAFTAGVKSTDFLAITKFFWRLLKGLAKCQARISLCYDWPYQHFDRS